MTPPEAIYLRDYSPPCYLVETVDLHFDLGDELTIVRSRLTLRRNPDRPGGDDALVLQGRCLELRSLRLDGRPLTGENYRLDSESLTITGVPEAFILDVETAIRPQENTSLEGLYQSSGNFCTQCEPQGFRKITYYPDRSDVMARFTTTIIADRRFPVLLANGNLVEKGDLEGGRHFTRWEDPFKKPSYLFALVAGDLVKIEDRFRTRSGREVTLQIYVEGRNADRCAHAMTSLQKAMAWDEETYGLEYDLDIYMIVAVDDFNFGAMENKGLNIFNSKYVLARPDTATDADYQGIEGVIGHEYFHNWTGNRVTCRDWFQLSLKEGLTVFRDQEFSADMTSRPVKRIEEVRLLRNTQFPEDAGPMAHPVRPASYVEINNFYTATVYNKGAEVIRMIHTLLGVDAFRSGLAIYLNRHDGQAVTTDDFRKAMAEAGRIDLEQFGLWYSQAGTPELTVKGAYDGGRRTYILTVGQSCPPTPGQQEKKEPFHIPLALGLLDRNGYDLPLQLEGEEEATPGTRVLSLRQKEETFCFINITEAPVPSLLRNFSAPVRLTTDLDDDDLAFLMARDNDPFNRWEAGQQLATRLLLRQIEALGRGETPVLDPLLISAFRELLRDHDADRALLALALTLPSETYLAEQMPVIDPWAIHQVREFFRQQLASELRELFFAAYTGAQEEGSYSIDPAAVGQRALKNLALSYLMTLDDPEMRRQCLGQFKRADNMTDVIAALGALAQSETEEGTLALEEFYRQWKNDPLVLDKWLTLQSTSKRTDTLAEVRRLLGHPAYNGKNPNKVRALVGAFCQGNPARYHDLSGEGYAFCAEQILALDPVNPQVAARLAGALSNWRRFDPKRQAMMKKELEQIASVAGISRDVYEIVSKSLA
jgi:aminopeptidase N